MMKKKGGVNNERSFLTNRYDTHILLLNDMVDY